MFWLMSIKVEVSFETWQATCPDLAVTKFQLFNQAESIGVSGRRSQEEQAIEGETQQSLSSVLGAETRTGGPGAGLGLRGTSPH
jgi:hypothetical protein